MHVAQPFFVENRTRSISWVFVSAQMSARSVFFSKIKEFQLKIIVYLPIWRNRFILTITEAYFVLNCAETHVNELKNISTR